MIKITKIYISSFGKLKDFSCTLKDGLNVIHEKNGFGKTTVAGFIKAMFFGLNSSNPRNIEANTRKRYTPWESTEKFGGYLCFETKGKSYRIERYFGKTPAQDTFMLYDENEVPCEDFGDNPGQALFDIDADAFERCMYIPQSGITVSPNDSFISKLNKLVENSDDDSNFQAAYKKLVKQYHHVTRLYGFQNQFAFLLLLLFHAQALGVLQFRDDLHIERSIVFGSLHIVVYGSDVVFFHCLAYYK